MIMRTAAAVLLAGLAFAACGEEGDPATSTSGGGGSDGSGQQDRRDAAVAFAECMREQGIDMPDPQFDENGGMQVRIPQGQDPEAVEDAQQECRQHLEGARGGGELSEAERAELQEQALAFAQCMRENGVDFPDPQFNEGGGMRFGGPGLNPEDPDFQEAEQACEDERPKPPGAADGAAP
jgi:hypothetical protein